jgi:hypothetical protein
MIHQIRVHLMVVSCKREREKVTLSFEAIFHESC